MEVSTFKIDKLNVKIFGNREMLGKAAAEDFIQYFSELLQKKNYARMIFAAAPSQNEFLENLVKRSDLDWNKVTAFHMDEYLKLEKNDPRLFQNFLKERIFSKLDFAEVNYFQPQGNDPLEECERYSKLLKEEIIDMVALGIGENGHIAFNDPPFAKFVDPNLVNVVELAKKCRQQQVNDGAFNSISDVPEHALSLSIPALINATALFCMVPGSAKAEAVKQALLGPVNPSCPASILRTHPNATLYLDADSGKLVM